MELPLRDVGPSDSTLFSPFLFSITLTYFIELSHDDHIKEFPEDLDLLKNPWWLASIAVLGHPPMANRWRTRLLGWDSLVEFGVSCFLAFSLF